MMASAFRSYAGDPSVLVFASGVSDSTEVRAEAFRRESELLQRLRREYPDVLLVYFGTCSVVDPDQRESPYVRHKLAMESQLSAAPGPWLVLRLPLAIGPGHRGNTLAKFLHERIVRGEPFDVWTRATRYPIDVEDAHRIAGRFMEDASMWRRSINVALRAYPVLDFVRILEAIAGRKAQCRMVERGQRYALQCPEVDRLLPSLHLDMEANYLENVLRKYFGPQSQEGT